MNQPETLKKPHICFSGSLSCSGCAPCDSCLEKVRTYVLPVAMNAAGFAGSRQQALVFFDAYMRGGWPRLHDAMLRDPALNGTFQVTDMAALVEELASLRAQVAYYQQVLARMQAGQVPFTPPDGARRAIGVPVEGVTRPPVENPPFPPGPYQVPPGPYQVPATPPGGFPWQQGFPGQAVAPPPPPPWMTPQGFQPPSFPVEPIQPSPAEQVQAQTQAPHVQPTLNGAEPPPPIAPASQSKLVSDNKPVPEPLTKVEDNRVHHLVQEMDAEDIAAAAAPASPKGQVLGNVMHVPPGMEHHLHGNNTKQ